MNICHVSEMMDPENEEEGEDSEKRGHGELLQLLPLVMILPFARCVTATVLQQFLPLAG